MSQGQTHIVCCSNLERIQSRREGADTCTVCSPPHGVCLSSEMFDRTAVGTKWRGPERRRAATTW